MSVLRSLDHLRHPKIRRLPVRGMRRPRVGKEDGQLTSQVHPRRDVCPFTGATQAGATFALHFPPPAITLSKFWEEFSMEPPTPSNYHPPPDDLPRREFLGAML